MINKNQHNIKKISEQIAQIFKETIIIYPTFN